MQSDPRRESGNTVEQRVAFKGLDYSQKVAILAVRGKYDLRDTMVFVPFALLDVLTLHRLTHELQQNGTLPSAPVPAGASASSPQ